MLILPLEMGASKSKIDTFLALYSLVNGILESDWLKKIIKKILKFVFAKSPNRANVAFLLKPSQLLQMLDFETVA